MNDQSKFAEAKDPRVEAALREYLERVDRGEPPDQEEFLARHAPIADQLRSFIAAEEDVRKLAAADAETPLDRAHDSTKSFVGPGRETVAPQSAARRAVAAGGTELSGQFGRYRIIRALGKGAMGKVYLAEDTQLERLVAIKTPHFTGRPSDDSLERFYREARVAATLRQPNICPVFDVGQIDGKHYISMAYIEGRPLSAFIQAGKPQAERQILIAIRKLALALQEAHDHGIVHRDLKPANIMVDKKGEPIVMDFGLARQIRHERDIRLTQTGNIIGTPAYMSPEQVEGDPGRIGSPTDQYSLGVILYELLTAQLPFRGSVIAVMGQILTKPVTPPRQLRPDLDPRIEVVCMKMLAKAPLERFASLKAVADELATILKNPATKPNQEDDSQFKPATSLSSDRLRADVSASQARKSLKHKSLTESDVASLEELARKCLARYDYEQVIRVIERIPEQQRNAGLVALMENARAKADEITFLICDIDEAERLNDAQTALKKAEALLNVKPGHLRALEVREKYSEAGEASARGKRVLDQFRRPLNDGGWIPWSVLSFGLAVFAVVAGVIVIYRNGTAVVIDIQDPDIEVAVKGTSLTLTGPGQQSVRVTPGNQELTISCAGLETVTKGFTINKGDKRTVTVSILDSKLVAWLDNETASLTTPHEAKTTTPTPSEKKPLPRQAPTHQGPTTAPPAPEAPPLTHELPVAFKNSLGMEFVLVPKGRSWLGGGGGTPGDKEVVIERDFYLGKYEVTQGEWQQVTGLNPSRFSRARRGKEVVKDIPDLDLKRYPVERISWEDAQAFLKRLNELEQEAGWVYRLPKEAEWEYACRGGPLSDKFESGYDFYFDKPTNQSLPEQANFGSAKARRGTCKVGSYRCNRLGLYDMHGNVFELCDDVQKAADGTPLRVARGGGWNNVPGHCRAAYRAVGPTAHRNGSWSFGLRVARVPAGKGKEIVRFPAEDQHTAAVVPGLPPARRKPSVAPAAKFSARSFLVRGEWKIENGELVQPSLASTVSSVQDDTFPVLIFGEDSLSNYDLTLEAKKTGGQEALGIYFHWLGPGHLRYFCLGGNRAAGNRGIDFGYMFNGNWGREKGNWQWRSYSSNQWYSLKVEVRGDIYRAYLDGHLEYELPNPKFRRGRIGLYTDTTAARFRRIKVSDPQGHVMFEGLPDLPPAGDNTNAKAKIDQASHMLTAGETAANRTREEWATRLKIPPISTNSLGMNLVLIPPGEFAMGSPSSELRRGNEQQHHVRMTKPFYLGVYEVTQSEFQRLMQRNPSKFSNGGGQSEAATGVDTSRYPVESVTWYDALEFCNKLCENEGRRPYYQLADIEREADGWIKKAKVSVQGGGGYCLPTEAQWEYACRAGTTTPFNFGTVNNGADCNCDGKLPYETEVQGPALGRTVSVGSYRPNAFGLWDMHGNVNEWCWDVFDPSYYGHSPESDPAASSGGSMRVLRGGAWRGSGASCRAAQRAGGAPGDRFPGLGFRVAHSFRE
ncbi:MAG TPA: SUMF1/EgtB/PvdO family nonheme iron enzyme [Planctomycetaceae bacterium]|nr:SUMF1/EgtB/PvdO family nonheme iron enzyme [Planctomycetaceae bacterium]